MGRKFSHYAVALLAIMPVSFAVAGEKPIVGPQIRIDIGGGTAAANETTCSLSKLDPNVAIAGWNDYRDPSFILAAFSTTFDGGKTWSDFILRPPAQFQSAIEGDPFTAFDDRTGTLWAGAISFGNNGGLYVARLDPGETQLNTPVMADIDGDVDKAWMVTGPTPDDLETTRLYITYNFGVIQSNNMGDSWTDPVSLGFGIGFLPRIGPGGEVYVAYWDLGTGMMLKRSLNGGASFVTRTIATRMDVWPVQDGSRFPGQFRVPANCYLDVDDNTGVLYAVYFDTTNIVFGNANVDLYFTKSEDRGDTWTTPIVINQDAAIPGDQFFPWIEVDEEGRLHIVYIDSRNTVQDDDVLHGMFDVYYIFSEDGGDNWLEFRLTPKPWDSALAGNGTFIGDYLGLAAGGNRIYPIYLDTHNGDGDIYTNVIIIPVFADLDGNGTVDINDLLILLANWGPCADCNDCPADLNDDCSVSTADLLLLFSNWG
ncbi:MAG: hypothetical protein IH984_09855 [Planctomycetes bacterium]|nr:hypothetical protein [Planctomycetota bacterium]